MSWHLNAVVVTVLVLWTDFLTLNLMICMEWSKNNTNDGWLYFTPHQKWYSVATVR